MVVIFVSFTSDFGEALRPVISARIVTGMWLLLLRDCSMMRGDRQIVITVAAVIMII